MKPAAIVSVSFFFVTASCTAPSVEESRVMIPSEIDSVPQTQPVISDLPPDSLPAFQDGFIVLSPNERPLKRGKEYLVDYNVPGVDFERLMPAITSGSLYLVSEGQYAIKPGEDAQTCLTLFVKRRDRGAILYGEPCYEVK